MNQKALRLLQNFSFPLILFLVAFFICIQNYTPGTFLSGWDTLHPEFDFKLNLMRTLFGVFRPEQGLGAVAAHAHMVELPRIAILFLLDMIFPLSTLRYLYFFICLIVGPIGMYFFLLRVLIKKKVPSFLGALFYLLNLGTYQTFIVPFEMFTTLYATLPFVFWLFSEYLASHRKRVLIFFSIAIILTSPAAYASTLWFVFFASLLLFFAPYVLIQRKTKGMIKRFIILLSIIVVLNLYWLLPNIYFAATSGTQVTSANINKLFSEEAFLKNKEFGTIPDILTLKSFYFDWGIYNSSINEFEQLTTVFQKHLENPVISVFGIIIASFIVLGLIYSAKVSRNYFPSFAIVALFCLLFLMNVNQPFTYFFTFFQEHVPLFKEAARFPDNKIFNVYIFVVSAFFSYTILFLATIIKHKHLRLVANSVISVAISVFLIIYMLPIFTGNLIHPTMKVTIPTEYFSLFSSLKNEPIGRIANFPVASPWGWVYHDWYHDNTPSFQGAGFLYFGITQPILERDFDRWNPKNEQYYREITHALYSQDYVEFVNVLRKYEVSHLLVDLSVINPSGDNRNLYHNELSEILKKMEDQKIVAKRKGFGNFLFLYTLSPQVPLLSTIDKVTHATPYNGAYFTDEVYKKYGNYIPSINNKGLVYPLNDLIINDLKLRKDFFSQQGDTIKVTLPNGKYTVGDLSYQQTLIPANIITTVTTSENSTNLNVSLYPATPLLDNSPILTSLSGNFTYSDSIKPILSVNSKIIPISQLQINAPTAVGSVFLNTNSNQLALFDRSQEAQTYSLNEIPFSFSYCNNFNNADLNIVARPDSLVLNRQQKEAACITFPLSFIRTPEESDTTYIRLNFTSDTAAITACLTNPFNGQCDEYLPFDPLSDSQIQFAINKNQLSSVRLKLSVAKGTPQQTLKNLKITSLQSAAEFLLDPSFFKSSIPNSFSTVELPRMLEGNYYKKADRDSIGENDCKGSENYTKRSFENDGSYKYYSAKGSFCDHVSFPNLPHSLSYLVYVKSKNVTGLPMTLCITNYTSRKCDIYSKLSKFATPQEDVFILPSSDPSGTGYDVNLENIGIKRSPSVNHFYEVTFVPLPVSFLSQIRTGQIEVSEYKGTIINTVQNNPHYITTQVHNGPALIGLSYAYNKDFKAYYVSCTEGVWCAISNFFRPLFGNEINHVELNSWKNAWIAPHNGNILILFLPQYLEHFGIMALVAFTTIVILYPLLNHFLGDRLDNFFEDKAQSLKHRSKSLLER